METYYQESGRAGRDGLPSECVLYFRAGDVPRQSSMVFYENAGLQNLYDMVRYCQSKRICRHTAFFRHFGEPLQDCNGMCDNCAYAAEIKEVDVTYHAKTMISLLRDMQENDQRTTILQLVDKFKGKNKELGGSTGSVSDLKKEELEQLIVQLILDRVLKEEFQHTAYSTNAYVTLGPLWKHVVQGKKEVKLEICSGKNGRTGNVRGTKRSMPMGLEMKLDELRKELSSTHGGIFPHAILSTQQISVLSAQKPTSMEQLEKLIGKLKTKKYGSRILDQILKYIVPDQAESDLQNEVDGVASRANKRPKTKRALVVVESSEDEQ